MPGCQENNCPTNEAILLPSMEEDDCSCYTSCENVSFKDIVGAKTIKNGGIFGDLLAVARVNIEDSKTKGELTETAAGEIYSQAIVAAMKEAVVFELSHGKAQKEIALIASQTEYQKHKIKVERDDHDLNDFIQRGKLSLERDLNKANIRKINQDIRVMIAQIRKIDADITLIDHQNLKINQEIAQSKHEVLKIDATTRQIDQQVVHSKAEIRKIEADIVHLTYQNSKIDQEIVQSQHEVFKIDATTRTLEQQILHSRAEIGKISADIVHLDHQNSKIDQEIIVGEHEVFKIDATTRTLDQQVLHSKAEINKINAERDLTHQKISESVAQSSLLYQQVQKIICECLNQTTQLTSKVALEKAQICKISCDCANSTSLMGSQAVLYRRQAIGFNDNAEIRRFEIQAQAYAMMFETLDLDVVPGAIYPHGPTLSNVTIPSSEIPEGNICGA